MLKISFKNVQTSRVTAALVTERFEGLINKFPDLDGHRASVTLEMENSRQQSGRDHFSASVLITGSKYKRLRLKKAAQTLPAAVALLSDGMLELLNRAGDRDRVRTRTSARRASAAMS